MQSLSETVGSLKEKIAGEIQLPANKQKLSGKPGFLKDNMSLAHYNVGGGETLTLTSREKCQGAKICIPELTSVSMTAVNTSRSQYNKSNVFNIKFRI